MPEREIRSVFPPTPDDFYKRLERQLRPRPVFQRLMLKRLGHRYPPTEAEKHDAILLLAENYQDEVGDEAFRILDEYGR